MTIGHDAELGAEDQARLGDIAAKTMDAYGELNSPVDVHVQLLGDLLEASGPWEHEQVARAYPAIAAALSRTFKLGLQLGPDGSFFDSLPAPETKRPGIAARIAMLFRSDRSG